MSKRLLIALPVAAVVVIGLFWAMKGLVPVGRPVADYRVIVTGHSPVPERCYDCQGGVFPPDVERPSERDTELFRQLPPPPRPLPNTGKAAEMPRERMDSSQVMSSPQDRSAIGDPPDADPCLGQRPHTGSLPGSIFKVARHGDFAIVEFALGADGVPRDIRVVESSRPEIEELAVKIASRWRYEPKCEGGEMVETEPTRQRVRIEFEEEE